MKDFKFICNDKKIHSGNKTILCGIVNATPDSFSDGGLWYNTDKACAHALKMISDGADIIDVGGESTRPGSTPISAKDEINRIVPVIKKLRAQSDIIISVDTWKSEVAKAAIEAGADIINDITGFLGDMKMAEVVGNSNAGAVLMFNSVIARPEHEGSKIFPKFGDDTVFTKKEYEKMTNENILDVMKKYFLKSLDCARKFNITDERIMLDPGIGFGLTKKENLELIKNIDIIHDMGFMSFLGVSRKRFIVNIIGDAGFETDPKTSLGAANRDMGSAYLSSIAAFCGVDVLRVHTIKEHLMAREIGDSIRNANHMKNINFGAYENS